jgi:hypothetical protein
MSKITLTVQRLGTEKERFKLRQPESSLNTPARITADHPYQPHISTIALTNATHIHTSVNGCVGAVEVSCETCLKISVCWLVVKHWGDGACNITNSETFKNTARAIFGNIMLQFEALGENCLLGLGLLCG